MSSTNQSQAIEYHGDTILERLNQVQERNNKSRKTPTDDSTQLKIERDNALKEVPYTSHDLVNCIHVNISRNFLISTFIFKICFILKIM